MILESSLRDQSVICLNNKEELRVYNVGDGYYFKNISLFKMN